MNLQNQDDFTLSLSHDDMILLRDTLGPHLVPYLIDIPINTQLTPNPQFNSWLIVS